MAIKLFIYSIIFASIFLVQFDVAQEDVKKSYKNTPNVVFYDAIAYQIDEKSVNQILQSKQVLNFDDRDELYDTTIIKRVNQNLSDSISAEYIVKTGNLYKLYQNVNINRNDGMQLLSDTILYDAITKIVSNNSEFILKKNGNTLVGTNLYLDTINEEFRADKTHFTIMTSSINKDVKK